MRIRSSILLPALLLSLCSCSGCVLSIWDGDETKRVDIQTALVSLSDDLSHYGEPVSPDDLLSRALAYDSSFSSDTSQNLTRGELADLLYVSYSSLMGEKEGIRVFETAPTDYIDGVAFSDSAPSSAQEEALSFLADHGLFCDLPTWNSSMPFSYRSAAAEEDFHVYRDRFHGYLGLSEKEDFFTYANRDYLITDCESAATSPSDFAYDNALIPQSGINAWAKEIMKEVPEAQDYESTYLDSSHRTPGDCMGLMDALAPMLNAQSAAELRQVFVTQVLETGYCPLWSSRSMELGSFSQGTQSFSVYYSLASSYALTGNPSDYAKGSEKYNQSLARFTPIFLEALGCDEETAAAYAEDYCDFKALFAHEATAPSTYMPSEGDGVYEFLVDCGFSEPWWFAFSNEANTKTLYGLLKDETLDEMKGFCIWQMLAHYPSCLPNGEHLMAWAYASKPHDHSEQGLLDDDLWGEYCLGNVEYDLLNAYVGSPAYASSIEETERLFHDLQDGFIARFGGEEWLSPIGKARCQNKVSSIDYRIGLNGKDGVAISYPTIDYLSANEGTLYQNIATHDRAILTLDQGKLGKSYLERGYFQAFADLSDPLTANAYYLGKGNGVLITMGFLASYDGIARMNEEEKLATYGWVIAHEIGHGFDTSGIYYDEQGNYYRSWLPEDDHQRFFSRAFQVVENYDGAEVMPGRFTDGYGVANEAIADITGLSVALDVTSPSFDYEDFFIRAARNLASYASQSVYDDHLTDEPHPFGRVRVNQAFQALDVFQETFSLQEGDFLYLSPEERYALW